MKKTLLKLFDHLMINSLFLKATPGKVRVLMYHGISRDEEGIDSWTLIPRSRFEQQLRYIVKHFDVLSIYEAQERILSQNKNRGRPAIVMTFDDGLRNNYSILLPLLKQYKVKATIFIATGCVESQEPFWFDKLKYLIQTGNLSPALDLRKYGLRAYNFSTKERAERWESINSLLTDLKRINPNERKSVCDYIFEKPDLPISWKDTAFAPLTQEEVAELSSSPFVTIGSHSHCHNILTQIPLSEVSASVKKSIELLHCWTGKKIDCFSYPNGNFNSSILGLMPKLGISLAVATCEGFWEKGTNPLAINRLNIGGYDSLENFKAHVSGPLLYLKNIRGQGVSG
jgi:peptidoglycan/xylan/chitin deacetylase (PgdA/CDA1 family)